MAFRTLLGHAYGAADLYALLDRHAAPLRAAMLALRGIAARPAAPARAREPDRVPPTPEELAHIRSMVAALRADKGNPLALPPRITKPVDKATAVRWLEDDQRRGIITPGGLMRLELYRRQLERRDEGDAGAG